MFSLPKDRERAGDTSRFEFIPSISNFMISRILGIHLNSWVKPGILELEFILMLYFIPVCLYLVKTLTFLGEIT